MFAASIHNLAQKRLFRTHFIPNINPPEAVKPAPSIAITIVTKTSEILNIEIILG